MSTVAVGADHDGVDHAREHPWRCPRWSRHHADCMSKHRDDRGAPELADRRVEREPGAGQCLEHHRQRTVPGQAHRHHWRLRPAAAPCALQATQRRPDPAQVGHASMLHRSRKCRGRFTEEGSHRRASHGSRRACLFPSPAGGGRRPYGSTLPPSRSEGGGVSLASAASVRRGAEGSVHAAATLGLAASQARSLRPPRDFLAGEQWRGAGCGCRRRRRSAASRRLARP